jgi:Saccharopine dehydrogenase NADP binding domain
MSRTVLLYGATGYTGRLIAAEGELTGMSTDKRGPYRMVLAGRDGPALGLLGRQHGMDHRMFRLDDERELHRGLTDVDVVINAAGPFALTAKPLARAALIAGSHYVDINSELNVYLNLDQLGRPAFHRRRAIVSGAGHSAAASDLLLHVALKELQSRAAAGEGGRPALRLGAVRIALSRTTGLSRGTLETLLRSLREQVTIVRMGEIENSEGVKRRGLVLWHEPVGKLERMFVFAEEGNLDPCEPASRTESRIATAANLVDTLAARLTVERLGVEVRRIESYLEAEALERLAYQAGALVAPLAALPFVRQVAQLPIDLLPDGPISQDLSVEPGNVLLDIEDPFQQRIVNWRWRTPNPYLFTAQVAVEVARQVVAKKSSGWLTPSAVLNPSKAQLKKSGGYLRGSRLVERPAFVEPAVRVPAKQT